MSGRDDDFGIESRGDVRLERELRGVLRRRDPGPAPYGLRGRVDRVPEEVREMRRGRSRALGAISLAGTAVAAGLLVAVLGGILGRTGGVGAGPATVTPGTDAITQVVFDPMTTGVGVVSPLVPVVIMAPIAAVIAAIAGLLALAWRWRARRRALLAGIAAFALAVGAGLVAQQPVPQEGTSGAATGGVVSEGSSSPADVQRVTAGPGGPYGFAVELENGGTWPVRIEGFVDEFRDPATGVPTMSAWFDGKPDFMGDPTTAFAPFDLAPGETRIIEISRIADRCAIPAIDVPVDGTPVAEPDPGLDLDVVTQDTLRLRWSVLGWPREDWIRLPFEFRTYLDPACASNP
jgi:hypothetical protein